MKTKTLFLKVTLALITGIVLLFNVFLFPHFPLTVIENYFFIGALYASALLFYFIVFQAFTILRQVDHDLAFSSKSLIAIRNIKLATFGIGVSYIALMPQIVAFADADDAPGMVLIGIAIILFPFIISTFVAVLQRLLQNAIDIKAENDLTV